MGRTFPTSAARPGIGTAIWLHATDVQAIHDTLVADGHTDDDPMNSAALRRVR